MDSKALSQQEYVSYKGIPSVTSTCDVQKQLELQQWILDPSSRPYDSRDTTGLIARSASAQIPKSTVQKQLELQRMILGD